MKMKALLITTVLILAAAVALGSSAVMEELSTRECENLGFTGLALYSDCKTLGDYVKDKALVTDCFKCCMEDSVAKKIRYSGAFLEVCMKKVAFYPEILGFVEAESDRFPEVEVRYVLNSPPKLIMLDDNGQQKETIRIDNWKQEHILQFLSQKVKPLLIDG